MLKNIMKYTVLVALGVSVLNQPVLATSGLVKILGKGNSPEDLRRAVQYITNENNLKDELTELQAFKKSNKSSTQWFNNQRQWLNSAAIYTGIGAAWHALCYSVSPALIGDVRSLKTSLAIAGFAVAVEGFNQFYSRKQYYAKKKMTEDAGIVISQIEKVLNPQDSQK
ncbi:MAG: hypothetical protein WDZ41_05775 [Candidatus Babeliales bacterium]